MSSFTALGSEFRVNTKASLLPGIQAQSSVAGLAGGGFVVTWNTPFLKPDSTFDHTQIAGQIFDANGAPVGSELAIVPDDLLTRTFPEVAALGAGFVVTFDGVTAVSPDAIFRATFDGAGTGTGAGSINDGSNQFHVPQIATSTAGTDLIVWYDVGQTATDTDQFAILAKVSGGSLITVNTTTAGSQAFPHAAALQDGTGNYVVTWTENDGIGTNEVKGQILAADGSKLGGEFTVDNDVASPSNQDMDIASRPGGGYAVAYTDNYFTHVKVYDASNTLVTDFFADVNPGSGEDEPAIAVLSNGLMAVAARDFNSGSFSRLAVFAPDGTQIGGHFDLQAGAGSGIITDPSIAALAAGRFVVTWTDNRGTLGDPNHGITGQRFATSVPTLIHGTAGSDAFNGATQAGMFLGYLGNDAVSYASAAGAVTVNLADPALSTGAAAGDEYGDSVERVIGSNFNDTFVGNGRNNIFDGGAGNDSLSGGDGDDTLIGGLGNDTLTGGNGIDTVDFSAASGPVTVNLTLTGAQNTGQGLDTFGGIENLIGSAFADVFTGQNLLNRFDGGGGDDELHGGSGNDTLNGDAGADLIIGDAGNDTIDGGTEIDRLYGGSSDDFLFGGAGADSLAGGPGVDRLDGGDGADRLFADGTPDTFVFTNLAGAGDRVFDFVSGLHDLEIDASGFGGTAGAFAFVAGSTPNPTTPQQTFLYDTDDGKLYFDATGTGIGARVHVLTLFGAPSLAAGDILLV